MDYELVDCEDSRYLDPALMKLARRHQPLIKPVRFRMDRKLNDAFFVKDKCIMMFEFELEEKEKEYGTLFGL